ncbi:2665_t:CDS:2 [Funneliformis geosporum]|uniref:2665_t:CDS:1 n=1 Tax=Funneliformis geosporum TaxID=1117311 RepID=A0A9W4SDB2_9GLOM|nr:2665_t:CDS:2 [Funneliformis geosporum]
MNNKIIDYISGAKVNATPEEIEAVQPLAQELVEVYGYNKNEIKTHPQFRISLSPSDEKKSYPVDIAVFEDKNLKIICECKKISSQEEETHPRYEELKPRENLKSVFYQIKKNLQKTVIGSTNEPDIAKNVLKILFCKIFDERYQSESGFVNFYANDGNFRESSEKVRIIFAKVKNKFEDVFDKSEEIKMDDKIFIGTALKGEHGQFFTPRNVVRFVINFLDVNETQKIIDPACGTGGFIVESLRYKIAVARKNIFGCDKDSFLAQACKAYMCILGDGSSNIWNEDSLAKFTDNWKEKYEIVVTNPPFGKTIAVEDEKILKNFSFWRKEKDKAIQPQILFLELCLRLLKKNGKLAIVLPEGIFGNESENYRKIREFLLENYNLLAIFNIPQETFEPFTGNKSSILILENKNYDEESKVIFANIQKIGHNKRGDTLYRYNNNGVPLKDEQGNFVVNDELSDILLESKKINLPHYTQTNKENKVFYVLAKEIKETRNLFLIPTYYNGFLKLLSELKANKKEEGFFISIGELIEKNILFTNKNKNIPRGKAVDSHFYLPYQEGLVPFIRTSDIQNLEMTRRPQNGCPPYQQVLSHGFVVDEKGYKMSKSLGNVIDPEELIKKFGVDILRNLANLPPELKSEKDFEKELSLVDYYILLQLEKLTIESQKKYSEYNFNPIFSSLMNFCINDLSSFYFEISKDSLYCDSLNSPRRKQIITTLYYLLAGLLKIISPMLPFLAEEVYQNIPFQFGISNQASVHLVNHFPNFQLSPEKEKELGLITDFFLPLRQDAYQALEKARQKKIITTNLQANLTIYLKEEKE